MNAKQVALFGGTFDPIHNGHLQIACQVLNQLNFNQVVFLPNNIPPHKTTKITSKEHRVKMLELALNDYSDKPFSVDLTEINRAGPSYMVDTISHLHHQANNQDKKFWLIIGLDSFYDLPNWHNWISLQQICNFIVINRKLNNVELANMPEWASNYLKKHQIKLDHRDLTKIDFDPQPSSTTNGAIVFINLLFDISATDVRGLLKQYYQYANAHNADLKKTNALLKQLEAKLPRTTLKYIVSNKLYS